MSLLEQNIIKREKVNNKLVPELEFEYEVGKNKEYKVKAIYNNTVYAGTHQRQLLRLYYLVS